MNEADIESVVSFVKLYGDQYGSKVKRSKIKGQHVIKLPLGETKSSVYRKYCETFEFGDVKKVARTTFIGIWKKHCPYITVTHVLDNACFKVAAQIIIIVLFFITINIYIIYLSLPQE